MSIANGTTNEYSFYGFLRAENFQHTSMAGCSVSIKKETAIKRIKTDVRQVIELTK